MIDIIVLAWIIWGALMARNMHLYFLIGDIVSVISVAYVFSTIDAVTLNQAVWQTFQDIIIEFYMWMEPLQSVQLQGDSALYVVVELFAYGLLVVFLIVMIAVCRNIIGAFSQVHIKRTIFNIALGCVRNVTIVIVAWSLLPMSIVQTYWFQELLRNTLLFYLL